MVNKLYPPDIGGVETVVAQYAKAAAKAGHHVEVLACHSNSGLPTITADEEGVHVTRCRSWGTLWSMPISPALILRYLARHAHFDAIHFHEPFPLGTLCALLTRHVPFIITWHSDIVRQRVAKPFFELLQRWSCKRAHAITTTSEFLARRSPVLSRFPEKVVVIPLSVDLEAAMQATGAPPCDAPYCLYLGRLAHYKGLDTLLRAAREVPFGHNKLLIVGDGPLREQVRNDPVNATQHVRSITRHVSEEEKHALLAHCQFLVFPSSAENEAFGIVQLEAMAHGKPVINTNLPTAVPWVSLHDHTGLTVPPGDAKALAAAMDRLLADPALCARLGANALSRVREHFSDAAVFRRLLDLYRAVGT